MRLSIVGPLAVTAAAILTGGGCTTGGLSPSEEQLVSSEQRWTDAGVENYSMVITRSTLTGVVVAAKVTVTNGTVSDRQFVDESGNPTGPVPASSAADYPDVEGLFALVRHAFDEAQQVTVTFDETYGFPSSIVINYNRVTIEDDIVVAVTNFTPSS